MTNESTQNYKLMLDMIDQLEEEAKTYSSLIKNEIEDRYGFNFGKTRKYFESIKSQIEFDSEGNTSFFDNMSSEEINNITENIDSAGFDASESDTKIILSELMSKCKDLDEMEEEARKLKSEANEIVSDYINYLTSPEYQAKKKERIEKLEEEAKNESDDIKKKKIMKMINSMKASMNLSFIFNRMNNYNSEKESIMSSFFDNRRSAYIIDRYKDKIKKLGYNPDIYKYFFNIEENFLDKKYHVYNNLFLFFTMRFVGYCDVYDKENIMYAQSLISSMANLIYYKFPSDEDKENFLNVIMRFLDYFEEYYNKFEKDNILHPEHPYRKKKDAEREIELREMIYSNLENNGIVVTSEIQNLPIKELEQFYKSELDRVNNKESEKVEDVPNTINDTNIIEDNSEQTVESDNASSDDVTDSLDNE